MKKPKAKTPRQKAIAKSKRKLAKANRTLHKKLLLSPITAFGLLCLGVILLTSTIATSADLITVNATVPAAPLTSPATITSPTDNSTITATPIEVQGNCPNNSYVVLVRNGNNSGSSICDNNSYSIQTDLSPGSNSLVAQDYNITNQAGPASSAVHVTYIVTQATSSPGSNQVSQSSNVPISPGTTTNPPETEPALQDLLLTTNYKYQAFTTSNNYSWQLDLSGGAPPYVVNVNWGDGTSSNLFFKTDPLFNIQHHYAKSGDYSIVIGVIDSNGSRVVTQVSSVIKASSASSGGFSALTGGTSSSLINKIGVLKTAHSLLWLIWPTYIIVILMAASFWLGERRELQAVTSRYNLKAKRKTK